jgi:hypothetical protein
MTGFRTRGTRNIGRGREWRHLGPFYTEGLIMSRSFERWKELAAMCLCEQDPARLAELANEMNLVMARKTPQLDSDRESWNQGLDQSTNPA